MAFLSKTFDKLKGALKKTWAVLNTDVGTLFIPGRQINEQWLTELEERFIQADMGVRNVERIVSEVRDRWRLGKIKNADEAEGVVREQLLTMLNVNTPAERELKISPTAHCLLRSSTR